MGSRVSTKNRTLPLLVEALALLSSTSEFESGWGRAKDDSHRETGSKNLIVVEFNFRAVDGLPHRCFPTLLMRSRIRGRSFLYLQGQEVFLGHSSILTNMLWS